jgi:hypothetical protein
MRFERVLTLHDYGKMPQDRTIRIHKRHGCMRNLKNLEALHDNGKATAEQYANFRFRITKSELTEVLDKGADDYRSFRGQIDTEFAGRPLAVSGWSASEKYILDELEDCKDRLRQFPNPVGRLSIVDPNFNADGHARLSAIYDVPKHQSHFPIAPVAGHPDQDNFFLWLQSIYALAAIHRTLEDHNPLQAWLTTVIDGIKADPNPTWITYWVDAFLPAWVQLCWRAGLVTASLRGRKMRAEEVKLEGDEWYVPLNQDLPDRPELIGAAYLLKALSDRPASRQFDFVPGALFRDSSAQLALPIPAWGDPSDMNMLNSVTRLAARIKTARGFASSVVLVAIGIDGTPIPADRKDSLQAAYLKFAKLPSAIDVIGLEAI